MLTKFLVIDPSCSRLLSFGAVLGILLFLFSQPVGAAGKQTREHFALTKVAPGWAAPVEEDRLTEFVEAAYAKHGQADFSTALTLRAKIASSVLSVADHHHRLTQRMGPGFEGFYLAHREPHPGLEFVPLPYLHDEEYTPDAPLKDMVMLRVTGEIGYSPLDYDAFIFRFVSPEGSCRIELVDPVFPGVNDFADDNLLAKVFPGCEGPQATAERMLLEAVPSLEVTGFDEATGTFMANTEAKHYTAAHGSYTASGPDSDGCKDYRFRQDYKYSVSGVCRDLFFGGGRWVRGGDYNQAVICVPEGDGCGVQTAYSRDTLHSSIRPIDFWDCGCCVNFGATVTGNTDEAQLISDNGTTGGHVAIAKSPKAWRTSTTQSMNALELTGQCAGDLDLPHHGGAANAGGAFDFKSENKAQTNKAEIGGWNAESIATHLCKPGKKSVRPKATRLEVMKSKNSWGSYPYSRPQPLSKKYKK